jgi:8-hydroxy-5-deazaflavin:NADPH oxidoreductase
MPESRWVEQQLGRAVIKACNNIYADHLCDYGRPPGTPGRIALPVAGNDSGARAVVMQFDRRARSWRQQPGTPVYATDYDLDGVRRALWQANPQRAPQWRATPHSPGSFSDPR